MNKLDAISRRGRGKRVMVGFLKAGITGLCACGLFVSISKLHLSGGITLAYEAVDPVVAGLQTEPVLPQKTGTPLLSAVPMAPIAESSVPIPLTTYPDPSDTTSTVIGAVRPEGWTGHAISYDEDGGVFLYGVAVEAQSGCVKDAKTQTIGGYLLSRQGANENYFHDAVFVGNSLTVGLQKSGVISSTYYANIGLSVRQFFEKEYLPSSGDSTDAQGKTIYVSAAEALAGNQNFQKVYLMFGINELGWSQSGFIAQYETVIDTILSIRPDATVYVQAIMPINETLYQAGDDVQEYCTNQKITAMNDALSEMAERKQVFFLIPGEAVCDEEGQLCADATTDGIHMNSTYLRKWANYLKTHTVQPEITTQEQE